MITPQAMEMELQVGFGLKAVIRRFSKCENLLRIDQSLMDGANAAQQNAMKNLKVFLRLRGRIWSSPTEAVLR